MSITCRNNCVYIHIYILKKIIKKTLTINIHKYFNTYIKKYTLYTCIHKNIETYIHIHIYKEIHIYTSTWRYEHLQRCTPVHEPQFLKSKILKQVSN